MDNITQRGLNDSRLMINSTDDGDLVSESVYQAVGGLAIVIMLVGIPGNFLVIASTCFNKQLRRATNFLVMTLSVSDLLFLSTVVPVNICCFLTDWKPPPKLCWVIGFATNWLLACSVLSTGAIAINRWNVIVLKSKCRQINGNKVVFVSIALVFLFPLILLSPTIEGSLGTFGMGKHGRHCNWVGTGIFKMINIGCVVVLPFVFMTFCYIWIVVFVLSRRKKIDIQRQTTVTGNINQKKETRLSQMLAMVYVVYLLTTLPALTMNMAAEMGLHVSYSVYLILFVVVWVSSAANPIMYGLVNKNYRDAYKQVALRIGRFASRGTETETVEVNIR